MKKTVTIVLATIMLFTLSDIGPAVAHTRIEPTRLTLKVSDKSVDRGDKVTFRGKLKSDWKKCRANKRVTLLRSGDPIASTKTSSTGAYKFRQKIKRTKTYRVRFNGKRFGTHPHVHRCLASQSRGIRVRARR